jgi:hypothetical protein
MCPTSSGVPQRPSGMAPATYSSIAGTSGLLPPPGSERLLHSLGGDGARCDGVDRDRSGAHSSASVRVSASTPALAAVAWAISGQPR